MEANLSDGDLERRIAAYLGPSPFEWAAVPVFGALLLVGLVGNLLVVVVVARNQKMHSVTNIFLVNLALADFLVLVFCLPPTVLWEITKTWWFGTALCKAVLYLQTAAITVSVLTMGSIAIERWYAICNPLSFKITLGWSIRLLAIVWILGLTLSLPEPLTVEAAPYDWGRPNFTTPWGTTCSDTWGAEVQKYYQLSQSVALFFVPLSIISVLYGQIAYVLWVKSAPPSDATGHGERRKGGALDRQVLHRRKAAKMLIAVVILFAVCYFPVHLMNTMRAFDWFPQIKNGYAQFAMVFLARFLTYFNSVVNPILYNFMSEKFQREFRRAFCCRREAAAGDGVATRRPVLRLTAENATLLAPTPNPAPPSPTSPTCRTVPVQLDRPRTPSTPSRLSSC